MTGGESASPVSARIRKGLLVGAFCAFCKRSGARAVMIAV